MSDPFADDAPARRPKRFSDPLGGGDSPRRDVLRDEASASRRGTEFSWRRLPPAIKVAVGGTALMLAVAVVLIAGTAVLRSLRTSDGIGVMPRPAESEAVGTDSQQSVADGDSPAAAVGASATTRPERVAPLDDVGTAQSDTRADVDWPRLALSIVYVHVWDCNGSGSGTVVLDGSYVLTNSHVVRSGTHLCNDIGVAFIDDPDLPPQGHLYPITVVADDPTLDLAVLKLPDDAPRREPISIKAGAIELGDEIVTLGFPGAGGSSITLTWGRLAGTYDDGVGAPYYKTDAMMNPGVSGGAAFDAAGRFVGVTTAGSNDEGGSLGLIRPANDAAEFVDRIVE